MARIVSSTKPASFRVSVWIATCTSKRVGHRERAVDGRGRGAPVLVQLQADGPRLDLLLERLGTRGVALAEEAEVHGKALGGLEHAVDVPKAPGVHVVAFVPVAGPVPPPIMVVTPAESASYDLLRADEVDVAVDAARGDDAALAGDHLGARADRPCPG